ncbi:MAG: amidohydrolase family protein [Pyrinomonadaceae bacterium]|nr:amidohydrolase family protein [Pyrinomonadaceae bacterium]
MYTSRLAIIGLYFLLLPGSHSTGRQANPSTPALKAFIGARIIDGTGRAPIENGVVVVRNGRIEAVGASGQVKVPAGAERIDVSGKTIIPGIINTHGHVGATRGLLSKPEYYTRENILDHLRLYARYGVTTVISLGGDQREAIAIRDTQETPLLNHARLYVSGPVLSPATPEEARRMVDELVQMKVDIAKIRVDDNLGTIQKMPASAYQAVIKQAHAKNLRVAAHMYYHDDAKSLLRSGVDFLAHSVRDREIDSELITLLKNRNVCVCPTLTREVSTFVYEQTPEFFRDPFFLREADESVIKQLNDPKRQQEMSSSRSAQSYKRALEVASKNLKALTEAGVTIAFGTDSGPPARFQGYFEHMEMELMAKAGLTPMQTLLSATRDAARCMGLAESLGTLEPGKQADLVVLSGNPLTDITKTKTLESVWIAGNRVPPRERAVGSAPVSGK